MPRLPLCLAGALVGLGAASGAGCAASRTAPVTPAAFACPTPSRVSTAEAMMDRAASDPSMVSLRRTLGIPAGATYRLLLDITGDTALCADLNRALLFSGAAAATSSGHLYYRWGDRSVAVVPRGPDPPGVFWIDGPSGMGILLYPTSGDRLHVALL